MWPSCIYLEWFECMSEDEEGGKVSGIILWTQFTVGIRVEKTSITFKDQSDSV